MKQLAFEEGVRAYDEALAVAPQAAVDEATRCELLISLGRAHLRSGAVRRSRAVLIEAGDLARRLQRPDLLAHAALASDEFGHLRDDASYHAFVNMLDEANRLLPPEPSQLRVEVMARLSLELYYNSDEFERGRQLAAAAVEMSTSIGDPRARLLTMRAFYATDLRERQHLVGKSHSLFESVDAQVGRVERPHRE